MVGRALAVAAVALAGCGGGETTPAPEPTPAGQRVAMSAGCLACHTIGSEGNDGPGQDLTRVGARLDRAEIERWLVDPEPPMPSYRQLPRADIDALVEYLAALR